MGVEKAKDSIILINSITRYIPLALIYDKPMAAGAAQLKSALRIGGLTLLGENASADSITFSSRRTVHRS